MLLLGPLTAAADWVGSRLGDTDGVLALAAFSSIFKLAGVVAFYPFIAPFGRWIERITGSGRESAVGRLEPALYDAGASVALEAGWRAILEIARGAVDAVRRRLAGESVAYAPAREDLQRTVRFLESLSLETTDVATVGPRLVRLAHALDHLARLHEDLTRIPAPASGWQPPAGFAAGSQALAAWLESAQDPESEPEEGIVVAIQEASTRLRDECKTGREKLLEDVALQRIPMETATAGLETLAWADETLYHAWGVAKSLRSAASVG
jgi:phosphate:Na+ symporter